MYKVNFCKSSVGYDCYLGGVFIGSLCSFYDGWSFCSASGLCGFGATGVAAVCNALCVGGA